MDVGGQAHTQVQHTQLIDLMYRRGPGRISAQVAGQVGTQQLARYAGGEFSRLVGGLVSRRAGKRTGGRGGGWVGSSRWVAQSRSSSA